MLVALVESLREGSTTPATGSHRFTMRPVRTALAVDSPPRTLRPECRQNGPGRAVGPWDGPGP